jgi:hypothetical protein
MAVAARCTMTDDTEERIPHPKNAPGPFFVEDGLCITCGMPEQEAPDLITGTSEGHCYFKKQPSTPEELGRAIDAVVIGCCGAVQFGGDDPEIIQEIARREGRATP